MAYTLSNDYWMHYSSPKSTSEKLQQIGDPNIISVIGEDISQSFSNTSQDLDSIKRRALPLTFKYGFSICDQNSSHYNSEKCESFRFNTNGIHDAVCSTIVHSAVNQEYKY